MDRKPSILLVNKDLTQIEFAVDILEKEGYDVHQASNMRAALSAINQTQADMIFCGLELEDISGEQFLSYLKKDPLRDSIPFVFFLLMGNQNQLSTKRAIQMGAEDLIFFPLDASILVSRIKNILQPHQRSDSNEVSAKFKTIKKSPDNSPKPEVKTANQNLRVEKRTEKRRPLAFPVAVEVSPDGKYWEPGVVANTSKSGAMIETTLRRRYGQKILVRDPKNENSCVASGSVAHVLLRENSGRFGIGIRFYDTAKWGEVCKHLREHCKKQNIGPISSNAFPINVEVSRDGYLWIEAQISGCNATSAHIETYVLAKPEDTLNISFDQHGIPDIIVGRIKQIVLGKKALLSKVEIDFDGDSGWFEVFAYFAAVTDPGMIAKKRNEAFRKKAERKSQTSESEEGSINEKWSKNILVQKGSEQESESATEYKNKQKTATKDLRFYQSLTGRTMDNYEVVSFISSGAMGGVFKGWDTALKRDVALKVISWELSSQKKFIKMFFKEARLISQLNHPNVSQIYNIGNSNDIIYYAMEFVHGENLLEFIKKKICFQTLQAVKYLRSVCCALEYVWGKKIIHRDIKPANIMLTSDDDLKIVDFGVAKLDSHWETKIVGTPLYLSPETILNKKVDHRSDIYSLGATFYHLIAGTPPFVDISLRKIFHKHKYDPVPSLKKRAPSVPNDLCDVIEKMLSKKVEDRFQSYREIIKCLDNIADEKQTVQSQKTISGAD